MSADPKSLATLAITASNTKRMKSSPEGTNDNHDDSLHMLHKFKSTDEFVAGWTAAFINTTALFPLNKLIFRQMAEGHGTQLAAGQMKEEGLKYLYRGILPPLIQKMFSVSIMFGSFGHYSKWVDSQFVWSPPVLKLAVAACLTGATEAVLTPLERVQMLLQDRSFHKDYKNTIDALVKMRKFGLAEYYRGLTCVLVRNGPSNILFFGLRDEIKKWISPRKQNAVLIERMQQINGNNPNLGTKLIATDVRRDSNKLNFIIICHDFLSGAILGMFISTLFYPLSVVRTRMQTRAPGTEFLSIVKAFRQVYNERDQKISRLFHGCFMNVMRQFLSWGIINCSYEIVLDALRRHD